MRLKLFVITVFFLLFSCSSSNIETRKYDRVNNFNEWSDVEREIYNILYIDNPIPNEDIWEIAKIRCDMLIDEGKDITHGGYPFISEYLRQLGFVSVTEILAYGYTTPESVVKAWLNSDDHRKAIESNSKYIGICAKDQYYVIIFCN